MTKKYYSKKKGGQEAPPSYKESMIQSSSNTQVPTNTNPLPNAQPTNTNPLPNAQPTNTNSQKANNKKQNGKNVQTKNAKTNNKDITNFNNVCQRLQKLHGSIEASFAVSEHPLNNYFSIPANRNEFNEYIANILSNFGEYLKTYQGLKGSCSHNNTNNKVIQIKDIDTLKQYLRVLWKFMIVIPIGQNANAPTILKNNMEKYLPEVFLNDFQNAFPNKMPNSLTGAITTPNANNPNLSQAGGEPNNNPQITNPNQSTTTNNLSQNTRTNNNNNKKPNKKQTLFLGKYFKENDPLLNTYAYLQLNIMVSIAKLLKFLDDQESKGLLVKP
jgi:hypothetical protein